MNLDSRATSRAEPSNRPGATSVPLLPATFSARFCSEHNCRPEEFVSVVLRRCIARHALPLVGLMRRSELFARDRELIESVADAVTMDEVRDAIDDFWDNPTNHTGLRRILGLRVSTRRLRRAASEYLPFTHRSRAQRRQTLPS